MKPRGNMLSEPSNVFTAVLAAKRPVHYKSGEVIFSQGDKCSDIYYILEGLVKLPFVSKRGKGALLGILGQGDFFGEACVVEGGTHLTSAIALVPSSIVISKRKTMLRLLEEQPSLASHFVNYLVARNVRMGQDLIDHLVNSSEKRLARILLILARYDDESKNPSILKQISQDTLAEMVGTTRSRVNFFMNNFRKQGLIHYNGGVKVHESLRTVLRD